MNLVRFPLTIINRVILVMLDTSVALGIRIVLNVLLVCIHLLQLLQFALIVSQVVTLLLLLPFVLLVNREKCQASVLLAVLAVFQGRGKRITNVTFVTQVASVMLGRHLATLSVQLGPKGNKERLHVMVARLESILRLVALSASFA